ncbi:hypothetical protein NHX12_027001 [Muraenolepis orangiensis]|uniref:Uncharacterized protein n=1 Tax=Muraenolepis orangiensis TaxID=630683 RepID=A0A9Q0ECY6_9TELE|nr:hypothetical protein NHX12_027001 [Muraenolepis orangiensis]
MQSPSQPAPSVTLTGTPLGPHWDPNPHRPLPSPGPHRDPTGTPTRTVRYPHRDPTGTPLGPQPAPSVTLTGTPLGPHWDPGPEEGVCPGGLSSV